MIYLSSTNIGELRVCCFRSVLGELQANESKPAGLCERSARRKSSLACKFVKEKEYISWLV